MNGIYAVISAAVSFGVTAVLGIFLIPYLRKLKYGQTILEDGPTWHKNKEGTPTMGGLMFIIGILVGGIAGLAAYFSIGVEANAVLGETKLSQIKIIGGAVMALFYGAIGFFDDYIKVVKKRNLGLTARQKLLLQLLTAAAYLGVLYLGGQRGTTEIPLVGQIDLGWFYWPLALLIITGTVNAVNLTDGIDGLCSSVTFFGAVAFMAIASISNFFGMSVVAAAVAGGMLGFLLWNFHPAKVFMGDTGSLFLGGFVCALAFGIDRPILILPIGLVFFFETLSVMLQVLYFKITKGKRLFKMSPYHHHLEMCGWKEVHIVTLASVVTIVLGAASIAAEVFG